MLQKANPLHILVVEDNEHDRAVFQRAMKKGQIECNLTLCERAEEAEDLLNRSDQAFDLVVMDFDLPGINGLEFFVKMRRLQNLPPFVMLTGAGSEKIAVEALQAGMYDYVVKDSQMGYLNLLPVILTNAVQRHAHDLARRAAQKALKNAKNDLERKVSERTAELSETVDALQKVIEKNRLTERALRQAQDRLRKLSRKILDAQENERRMVAQEIHDSIGGSLAAIKFALEEKLESMQQNPAPEVISLESIISHVDQAIGESRRISAHLRPSLLDDLGLLSTISWYCREFENMYPGIQIEQQLEVVEEQIPERLKVVVYRVLQEGTTNAGKHSDATRIRLSLRKEGNRIKLVVADNGHGFDPEAKLTKSDVTAGFGLAGMRDRTMLCDGRFEIASEIGKGTTIHVCLPCDP